MSFLLTMRRTLHRSVAFWQSPQKSSLRVTTTYLWDRTASKPILERSIKAAEDFAARVHELLQAEGGSIERVVHRIKVEQHDPKPGPKQPDEACLLNLTAQVTHLARKNASITGKQ